ncbi:amidohydrolase family protein [Streptomyces sp. 110]|uniref:Amidohydrolase family protein n=1 Tax=Streptomyces endocoffeicus TaxID=2898945 RepID=A0ABS1Q1A7_9ACTN|nr:amidohydrolase family protein [Streptomyces endocoffeicus]MBL1118379.1 amidohydrolase family protein [Streptomyces endocoffeicus]
MTVIDAHQHVWDLSVRDQDWLNGPALEPLRRDFTLDDLRPQTAAAGVDATVLVQTICVPEETPEFLALATGDPLAAGVVGWTDLTSPAVTDALAELRALPGGDYLVGIRHQVQGEADPDWLLRPEVDRGLAAVASAGLAYDLVLRPEQLPAAVEAARARPELTFVLDHLGKPPVRPRRPDTWANDLRALARLPNTVAKLSGLVTEANWDTWSIADLQPFVAVALEVFGPRRLMFGSDWPVCTLAADYGQVVATTRELLEELSAHERDEVLGGTAARVYRL